VRNPGRSFTRASSAELGRPRIAAVRALPLAMLTVLALFWSGRSRYISAPPASTIATVGSSFSFCPALRQAATIVNTSSKVRHGLLRMGRSLLSGWR
jgi:hypothetical protein